MRCQLGGMLVSIAACSPSIIINVTQDPAALGGLTERIEIVEFEGQQCGGYSPCPDDPSERNVTATVVSGNGVTVSAVSNEYNKTNGYFTFTATGVAEGSTTIEIRGDDIVTKRIDVTTAAVSSSSIAVAQEGIAPPFESFTNTSLKSGGDWYFDLRASYLDQNGSVLAGGAVGVLTTTDPELTCFECGLEDFTMIAGTILGHGTITTVGTSADIDVVGTDAIADFSIDKPQPLSIAVQQKLVFLLKPVDTEGHQLIGVGEDKANVTNDDSDVASAYADTDGGFQSVHVIGNKVGTTVIHVVMANVEHSYTANVVEN